MALDEAVEVFKALADPTRLRLLALLHQHGTLCVCELEQVLGLPQYTVSRHLGILRRAGLLHTERNGARVDYLLRPDLDDATRETVDAAVQLVLDDPQSVADERAARQVRPAVCGKGSERAIGERSWPATAPRSRR